MLHRLEGHPSFAAEEYGGLRTFVGGGTLCNMGLEQPDNYSHNKWHESVPQTQWYIDAYAALENSEFWFTEEGWQKVGKRIYGFIKRRNKRARKNNTGFGVVYHFVMPEEKIEEVLVLYKDDVQIALGVY